MKPIFQTGQFKKDTKRLKKRGKDLDKLAAVVRILVADGVLEPRLRGHALTGRWAGSRDCHIEPDWILIYRNTSEALYLERTGSHADLFE